MKNSYIILLFVLINILLPGYLTSCNNKTKTNLPTTLTGTYFTGNYHDLFTELLNLTDAQVKARLDSACNQLFYGSDETQRLYYPVEPDMAYIKDINNNDVRSEGMSYGMMISIQLNKKQEFDRIWKWAKTYMQHKQGPAKNYFAWHCRDDGSIIDSNSASDGEEWIVMALISATERLEKGKGNDN